jgi:hypothetical protein
MMFKYKNNSGKRAKCVHIYSDGIPLFNRLVRHDETGSCYFYDNPGTVIWPDEIDAMGYDVRPGWFLVDEQTKRCDWKTMDPET